MNKWGLAIAILGTVTAVIIGGLAISIWNRPTPAPAEPSEDQVQIRRLELEKQRLEVEALRLRAKIQSDLVRAESELDDFESDPQPSDGGDIGAKHALVDSLVDLADTGADVENEIPMKVRPLPVETEPIDNNRMLPRLVLDYEPDQVAFGDFREPLEPYGEWFESADYGPIWQPDAHYISDGWAPYTNGSWGYSEYGWTWASEEPFSWACDHYGRWVRLNHRGWCWVPGHEWAPAWVSWRTCDTHIGWAPLPPCATWNRNLGIGHWVDAHCNIGPAHYHFVDHANFGSRNCRRNIVDRKRNFDLVSRSRNITHIHYDRHCINNRGPEYRSDLGVPKVKVDLAVERGSILASRKASSTDSKVLVKLKDQKVDSGWRTGGKTEVAVDLRRKMIAQARKGLVKNQPVVAAKQNPPERKVLSAMAKRPQKPAADEAVAVVAPPVVVKKDRAAPVAVVKPIAVRNPAPSPAGKADAIEALKNRQLPEPEPVIARVKEEKAPAQPDHFAAEMARREEMVAKQQALMDQRQQQADEKRRLQEAALKRLDEEKRIREERIAAAQRVERVERQKREQAAMVAKQRAVEEEQDRMRRQREDEEEKQRQREMEDDRNRKAQIAMQQKRQRDAGNARDEAARQQRAREMQQRAEDARRRADQDRQRKEAARAKEARDRQMAEKRAADQRKQQQRAREEQQRRARDDARRREQAERAKREQADRARRAQEEQRKQQEQQRQKQKQQSPGKRK